ncbi:midasin-like, partial [Neolamprologus brichardi]|uniref:midasin-like n=1 Tax=Neolamprologus brichardi TaxID=32507 RepID=UPI0003EBD25A
DFVKICKWNDVNFWSIKQSVEKTHRTLFKFIKQFEEALNGPSIPALVEQGSGASLDSVDANPQEMPIHRVHQLLKSTLPLKSRILQMKKMCIQLLKKNPVPELAEDLDCFTGEKATAGQLFAELLTAWDGCQKYFYQSWARNTALQTALQHAAKELGLGNVERCRGFSSHLFKLLLKQRRRLAKLTEQWVHLRRLTDNVQGVKAHLQSQSEEPGCTLPPQASLQDWVKRGQALAAQCNTLLQQLAWLLHCCPEDLQKEEVSSCKQHTLRCPSPLAAQRQPPGCLMRRGDAAWCQLHQRVTTMLEETQSLKVELDCAAQSISDGVLHTWNYFTECCSAFNRLGAIGAQMPIVEQVFTSDVCIGTPDNQPAVIQSLQYVRGQVEATVTEFTTWRIHVLSLGHDDT